MSWRQCDDPWQEAERLEVKDICRRMGWSRKRLERELNRVASEEKFLTNVAKALQELDPPRFMHKNPAYEPTSVWSQSIREPDSEMVPAEYEDELAKENRAKDMARNEKTNEARKRQPLLVRLAYARSDAQRKGINIESDMRNIERKVEQIERKVDRV